MEFKQIFRRQWKACCLRWRALADLALETIARPPMRSLSSNHDKEEDEKEEKKKKKEKQGWDWADLIGSA